jgi:hypothetical protein
VSRLKCVRLMPYIIAFIRTGGSAVLWRIFIEFEIRVGQLLKAKNLLLRAIGNCPLVKGSEIMP